MDRQETASTDRGPMTSPDGSDDEPVTPPDRSDGGSATSPDGSDRRSASSPVASGDEHPTVRTFLGLLTDPAATFRGIVDRTPVGWAVGIVVVVSLFYGLNAGLAWGASEPWLATFPAETPPERFAPMGLAVPIVFWLIHPLVAGVLRLTARLLGGRGDYRGMFTGYAFALTPSALSVLGLLPDPFGWLGPLFSIWTLALLLYAIRANERLSTTRALAVIALPLLMVAVATTAALVLT